MKTNEQQSFYSFREHGTRYGSFGLEIVPGKKCQLQCRNCYKHNGAASTADTDMPPEFVYSAIRQAKECGFAEIVLIGGEPTLHESLPGFIEFILAEGLKPILVTNGIKLADPEYARSVALEGTTLVLHAPLPREVQDQHSGHDGYAEKLVAAYGNVLDKKGVTIVGEITIIAEFLPCIVSAYRWCLANGVVPFIEISRPDDNGDRYSGSVSPETIMAVYQQLRKTDPAPSGPLVPPAYGLQCTMSITGLHVKNFGHGDFGGVYSCCAQHIRHGDLRVQPLAEIMASPSLEVFVNQDRWIVGPCRDCEHYPVCRGGCRGEAFLTFGCPRASYPCWLIPPEIRNNPLAMAPETCANCPLQNNPACRLIR